jgi:hypothetical protein
MTREEKIRQVAQKYIATDKHNGVGVRTQAFIGGAEWADSHPASPWHSFVDGDLPPKAKNNNRVEFSIEVLVRLDKNRLDFGRYDYTYKSWYVGLQRVHPTHWMEIPKLPTE